MLSITLRYLLSLSRNASSARLRVTAAPMISDSVRKGTSSFSPQILTWMINDGYGQVLSRPGAIFPLRELSVVATLTVTSYVNQLGAHIRGALNVGVEPALISSTMDNCRYFCSQAKIKKARKILAGATADK